MAKLLANREYAEGLATQAKVRARERFHPQNIAGRHLEIYSQIASSRPSAARTPAPEVGGESLRQIHMPPSLNRRAPADVPP